MQTWCRLCGEPTILEVYLHYGRAVREFYALDDQAMIHKSHHEHGGWGVHWRLDDVLRVVFHKQHQEELWPKPAWYPQAIGESCSIEPVSDGEIHLFHSGAVDQFRDSFTVMLTNQKMGRAELERFGQVWDEFELARDFKVLGVRTPFMIVERKADHQRGTLLIQDEPLYFYAFDQNRII